jgi:hypothetical protein
MAAVAIIEEFSSLNGSAIYPSFPDPSAFPHATLPVSLAFLMTARQARKARRAAERQAAKEGHRAESASSPESNRATQSTGPKTPQGKNISRWNSFKHGLYAKQLVRPGDDPAQLDALRATLPAEHQPANQTEEILVNEIAENFWRLRRFRELEARGMQPENVVDWLDRGLLPLIARSMASAERALHKAVTALRRLQLDHEFVPSKNVSDEAAPLSEPKTQLEEAAPLSEPKTLAVFVPSISQSDLPNQGTIRLL